MSPCWGQPYDFSRLFCKGHIKMLPGSASTQLQLKLRLRLALNPLSLATRPATKKSSLSQIFHWFHGMSCLNKDLLLKNEKNITKYLPTFVLTYLSTELGTAQFKLVEESIFPYLLLMTSLWTPEVDF